MSCMMSGVNVPSEVTEDEVDVSRPLKRLTWLNDVDEVPIEAVVVDLQGTKYFVNADSKIQVIPFVINNETLRPVIRFDFRW